MQLADVWAELPFFFALQDVAALESQPLLGFFLREEKNGPAQKLQFKLYHKNTLFYIFRADDIPTAQRYVNIRFLTQMNPRATSFTALMHESHLSPT